jgi:hypothetical protein
MVAGKPQTITFSKEGNDMLIRVTALWLAVVVCLSFFPPALAQEGFETLEGTIKKAELREKLFPQEIYLFLTIEKQSWKQFIIPLNYAALKGFLPEGRFNPNFLPGKRVRLKYKVEPLKPGEKPSTGFTVESIELLK